MKILYPHGEATPEEIEEILRFAIEGRKRVKDQILRIDSTMADVKFGYLDTSGTWHPVSTLEEDEYPGYYYREGAETSVDESELADAPIELKSVAEPPLFEGHREFQENQRGVSFSTLLVPYLRGATQITITDPYIRQFHQARNLMELIEGIAATKDAADEVNVKLITSENNDGEDKLRKQLELLVKIKQGAQSAASTSTSRSTTRSTTARLSPTPAGRSCSAAASTSSSTSPATPSTSRPSSRNTATSRRSV